MGTTCGKHGEYVPEGTKCQRCQVADLQRLLRQAQEERGVEQQGRQGTERQRDAAIKRAEAAERNFATEHDALVAAEALVEKGQHLREELEEVGNHAVGIIWDGELLAEWDALKAPAGAPQAKHQRPQSGQEESGGD